MRAGSVSAHAINQAQHVALFRTPKQADLSVRLVNVDSPISTRSSGSISHKSKFYQETTTCALNVCRAMAQTLSKEPKGHCCTYVWGPGKEHLLQTSKHPPTDTILHSGSRISDPFEASLRKAVSQTGAGRRSCPAVEDGTEEDTPKYHTITVPLIAFEH